MRLKEFIYTGDLGRMFGHSLIQRIHLGKISSKKVIISCFRYYDIIKC